MNLDRARIHAAGRRIAAIITGTTAALAAQAATLQELPAIPATLSAASSTLDVLMVARPAAVPAFGATTQGWVYDVCLRTSTTATSCPTSIANPYGGSRLQVKAGDLLKIRLVNKLPALSLADADHLSDKGSPLLMDTNPTNIHTHGLLVSPRGATSSDPTFGDNVFVLTANSTTLANLSPADLAARISESDTHFHAQTKLGYTDYTIQIPVGHPSGIYWIHPHLHGLALNQVSAGLSAMLTVGTASDYVCKNLSCATYAATIPVRHMMLRDTQVLASGKLMHQQDPAFCSQQPLALEPARNGFCTADPAAGDPVGSYKDGKWFHTINGQVNPTIPVAGTQGEIWRITAASGSETQEIHLVNTKDNSDMVVQVLSVDGIAVTGAKSGSLLDWLVLNSKKGKLIACPGYSTVGSAATGGAPLCATNLVMMPGSRAELWVAYRDSTGKLVTPPSGASARLYSAGFSTAVKGVADDWPAVTLAQVTFAGGARGTNDPTALAIGGDAATLWDPATIATALKASNQAIANQAVGTDVTNCKPIANNHSRRVFFGNVDVLDYYRNGAPKMDPLDPKKQMTKNVFALGFEEIDSMGFVVGKPAELHPFDEATSSICTSLLAGNTTNFESWHLVNLTPEDHNFHLHQLRFRLVSDPTSGTLTSPSTVDGNGVAYDNLPLRHTANPCLTVSAWHDGVNVASSGFGKCTTPSIKISVPFSIAGDYLYHCHILEHEDGGMMAKISVKASPN
jgi:L-ascorbate oxidase